MQRAIPQRRAIMALLAIVAAMATTPFAGLTGSAHGTDAPTAHMWCPPIC